MIIAHSKITKGVIICTDKNAVHCNINIKQEHRMRYQRLSNPDHHST